MRIILLLALFLITSLVQTEAQEYEWYISSGGTLNDRGFSVLQTFDGGYLIVGHTDNHREPPHRYRRGYAVKASANGQVEWERPIGSYYQTDLKAAFEVDDGYLLFGDSQLDRQSEYHRPYIAKVDRQGRVQEELMFNESDTLSSILMTDVIRTRDGGYAMVARGIGIRLYRLSADRRLLWHRRYEGNRAHSVEETRDGGFILAGYTGLFPRTSRPDPMVIFVGYLLRVSSTGDSLWAARPFGTERSTAALFATETDAGFFVAGQGTVDSGPGVCLVRTSPAGEIDWTKNVPLDGHAECITVDRDGDLLAAGGNADYRTAEAWKITRTGDVVWRRRIDAIDRALGYDIHRTYDGGYIVGGIVETVRGNVPIADVLLVKLGGPQSTIRGDLWQPWPFDQGEKNCKDSWSRTLGSISTQRNPMLAYPTQ